MLQRFSVESLLVVLVIVQKKITMKMGKKMVQHKMKNTLLTLGELNIFHMDNSLTCVCIDVITIIQLFCLFLQLNPHCPITLYFVLCRTTSLAAFRVRILLLCTRSPAVVTQPIITRLFNGEFFPSSYIVYTAWLTSCFFPDKYRNIQSKYFLCLT